MTPAVASKATSALARRVLGTAVFLLGVVLFHLNLTASVPPIGYLTYADKFMIVNYIGAIGSLVATVMLIVLFGKNQDDRGMRVHKISRTLGPGAWLALQIILILTLIRNA